MNSHSREDPDERGGLLTKVPHAFDERKGQSGNFTSMAILILLGYSRGNHVFLIDGFHLVHIIFVNNSIQSFIDLIKKSECLKHTFVTLNESDLVRYLL